MTLQTLPTQANDLPKSVKHNDPQGNEYFYYNEGKKAVYLRLHLDRKTTIDRKASDKDKIEYSEAWKKFDSKRKAK